jgi:hypothetical protein
LRVEGSGFGVLGLGFRCPSAHGMQSRPDSSLVLNNLQTQVFFKLFLSRSAHTWFPHSTQCMWVGATASVQGDLADGPESGLDWLKCTEFF